MSQFIKQLRVGFSATLITVMSSVPVLAEDIEIYLSENTGTGAIQPNIMFILDTSGSMGNDISSAASYDINIDWKAKLAAEGTACALFDDAEMYVLPRNDDFSDVACTANYADDHFDVTQNVCYELDRAMFGQKLADGSYDYAKDAAGDFIDADGDATNGIQYVIQGAVGFKRDRYTQWKGPSNKTWNDPLFSDTNASKVIECLSDDGEHGLNDASTDLWVAPRTGNQYANSETSRRWRDFSNTRTYYSADYAYYLVYANTVAPAPRPKIDVMRDTIITIMDGGVSNVDVGLMRFNSDGSGGRVTHPVLPITRTRNDIFATMRTWNASGNTPLTESVYEAMRYFSGAAPVFPDAPLEGSTLITLGSGSKIYKSPVNPDAAECERQFIILLSDGEPVGDTEANAAIEGITNFVGTDGGSSCDGQGWDRSLTPDQLRDGEPNGLCLDDLTKHLSTKGIDVALNDNPSTESAASLTGDIAKGVLINTYTVGFDIDSKLLKDAGIEGAGADGYKTANSAGALLKTLVDLIDDIKGIDTTFASPAVSVNAFNRTTNRNDLYFTLFKPDSKAHWDGNFKRFKLTFDSLGVPIIVDAKGNDAIDPVTGFFANSAESFWTSGGDLPDGSKTEVGGAASKLTNVRNLYSNLDLTADLTAAANNVVDGNANVTDALMGGITGTAKTDVLNWMNGLDVKDIDGDGNKTEARRQMGDPLHSQPALVEYKDGATTDPYIVSYVATNDGYLHAFDTRTAVAEPAKELFSFIPKDLLQNMNTLYENTSSAKQYGLDGTVSSWVQDNDNDGIIETADSDRVIIFFGMRRGGNDYFALDVTVPTSPKFLWKINGGTGDFAELGQSWSTPQVRKVRVNGADKQVLIFAAGYDTDKDDKSVVTRTADDIGRGVFIVDALTGALLWDMGPAAGADLTNSDMVYSMPSDVAAADASGDGYVDHLYVGDMGGQMWRIDIDNNKGETLGTTVASITSGGRIGDLADSTAASNRRFYYPPDVAILKDALDQPYISLLVTSGNRSYPTDRTVQDRVFMMRDLPVLGKPTTYTTLTVNNTTEDLFNTTSNLIGQGTDAEVTAAVSSLQGSNGWFVDFDATLGEKGLTKPLIFLGEAFFATYVPNDPSLKVSGCAPAQGTGFLYHINLENGTPVKNYDIIVSNDDSALTKEDRRKTLTRSGIPADPTLIIPKDGAAVCVGTECDKAEGVGAHKRVFWFEE